MAGLALVLGAFVVMVVVVVIVVGAGVVVVVVVVEVVVVVVVVVVGFLYRLPGVLKVVRILDGVSEYGWMGSVI